MAKSYEISQSQLLEIEAARKKNRNKNVERRLYVLVMRAEGKSLEEISKKTGYHISTASKLIARYMRDGISATAQLTVEVPSVSVVDMLLHSLRRIKGVKNVYRINS